MRIARFDGMRGVAIILVVGHHTGLISMGWVGVDLFFVLSGFLITGILRRDRHSETYWRAFYIKRATRILPALAPLFAAAIVLRRAHPLPLLGYVFFLGNFLNTTHAGVPFLGVLWSLAVEEHFYLLFPVIIRFAHRRSVIKGLLATMVIEPVLRAVCVPLVPWYGVLYQWTPFHLDGICLGALLALLAEEEGAERWLTRHAGMLCLGTAAIFAVLYQVPSLHFTREGNTRLFNLLGYSLLAFASAMLLAYVRWHPANLLSRMLEGRALVWIGTISYGLYLYHIPVQEQVLKLQRLSHPASITVVWIAALLVSWASFRWYEQPITRWGQRVARRMGEPQSRPATV